MSDEPKDIIMGASKNAQQLINEVLEIEQRYIHVFDIDSRPSSSERKDIEDSLRKAVEAIIR